MNMKDIESKISELNTLFKQIDDDSEDFDNQIMAVHRMSLPDYLAFLEERSKTPYGQVFLQLRDFVVPTLLNAYCQMNFEERQGVLDFLATHDCVLIGLWSLMDEYRWQLQKSPLTEKPTVLMILLLIAVLAERYIDQVETAIILTSAWGAAEQAGLSPNLFFQEAADVAGQRKLNHGMSAQEVLKDFEPYDYGRSTEGRLYQGDVESNEP